MTKQEWKLRYSAFRRLYHGLFNGEWPAGYINEPSFRLAADAVYRFADEFHWSILYAEQNSSISTCKQSKRYYYPIKKGVKIWQIRANTKQ